MGTGSEDGEAIAPPHFDAHLAAQVNAALIGELDEGLAVDPRAPFGDERRLFAALYVRHRYGIAQRAARYLRDPRDVEEVVQETFLRLFLALPELDNEATAVAWCRRTATNLCIDRYRAAQRRPSLIDLEHVIDDIADEGSVEEPLLQAEDAAIVRHALSLLSPQHRDALIKREIEEKTLPQIAAEMDIPEESVKHLLYRARRALRRLLVGTSVAPGADLEGQTTADLLRARAKTAGRGGALLLVLALVIALPRLLAPSPDVSTTEPPRSAAPLAGPSVVDPGLTSRAPSAPAGGGTEDAPRDPAGPPADAVSPPTGPVETAVGTAPPPQPQPAAPAQPAQPASAPAPAAGPAAAQLSSSAPAAAAGPSETADPGTSSADDHAAALASAEGQLSPRYSLSGAPVISSEGFIHNPLTTTESDGTTTSSSSFIAPTSNIDLTLNQTLIRRADGTTEFRFDPVFGFFGTVVDTVVTGRDTFIVTNSDGSVTVSVNVVVADPKFDRSALQGYSLDPAVDPAADPAAGVDRGIPTRIIANLVFSADLTTVLTEDVTLS